MSDEDKKQDAKPEAEAAPETAKSEEKVEQTSEDPSSPRDDDQEQRTDVEEAPSEKEQTEAPAETSELPNRDIRPGMVVRVHEKIKDISPKGETRERVQVFEGLVLGVKGKGLGRTMTVRKDAKGWMVEKIFPLSSPNIDKVEVVKQYRARRAKLTFLRGKYKKKLQEIKKDAA